MTLRLLIFAIFALVCSGAAFAALQAPLVMFTAIEGRVTRGGAPVIGARVLRRYSSDLDGQMVSDSTVTDSQGHFSFPMLTRRAWLTRWLPHEPFIEQTIDVDTGNGPIPVWMLDKRNYRSGGEAGPANQSDRLIVSIDLDLPTAHRGSVYGKAVVDQLEPSMQHP